MDWLIDWLTNPYLLAPLSAWALAQIMKAFINLILTKKWDFERLFGDGGMPSGHSATVAALATSIALHFGTGSVQFAMAFIFAIVVCHDATGVRQEAGKHAMLISELLRYFEDVHKETIPEVKLKKFVGHTLVQVAAGIAIGICVALLLHFFITC